MRQMTSWSDVRLHNNNRFSMRRHHLAPDRYYLAQATETAMNATAKHTTVSIVSLHWMYENFTAKSFPQHDTIAIML